MKDAEHAKLMLTLAKKDLKALTAMFDESAFDHEIFGFHAQQAVEKILKAWLSLIGVKYPWTHDLEELLLLLRINNQEIPSLFSDLAELTDFAVQFRYQPFEDLEPFASRPEMTEKITKLNEHVHGLVANIVKNVPTDLADEMKNNPE